MCTNINNKVNIEPKPVVISMSINFNTLPYIWLNYKSKNKFASSLKIIKTKILFKNVAKI